MKTEKIHACAVSEVFLTELVSRAGTRDTEGKAGQEDEKNSVDEYIGAKETKRPFPPLPGNVERH